MHCATRYLWQVLCQNILLKLQHVTNHALQTLVHNCQLCWRQRISFTAIRDAEITNLAIDMQVQAMFALLPAITSGAHVRMGKFRGPGIPTDGRYIDPGISLLESSSFSVVYASGFFNSNITSSGALASRAVRSNR